MTDTSTLREARNKVHTLRLFGPITDPLVKKSEVLAILDAQTEQPDDLQLSGPKVGSAPQDQTGVSTAPDAVAEAAIRSVTAFLAKEADWFDKNNGALDGIPYQQAARTIRSAISIMETSWGAREIREGIAKGHQP
ncbi:hypothetical protein [Paracoccus sp. 22332]|uniref:hypothetical protein n=1 Tax=Paracoccus sp. 22332 TaxID=3453913 RepID=UPI003F8613D9